MKIGIIVICCLLVGCTVSSKLPKSEATNQQVFNIPYTILVTSENQEMIQDAIWQMKHAETYFHELNIHFQFCAIRIIDNDSCWLDHWNNINIFLIKPSRFVMEPAGWTINFPWEGPPSFKIYGNQDTSVYGHEIGHSLLGLKHSFADDGVDDTYQTNNCGDKNDTNLMGYSMMPWYLQTLTPGQIERAKLYLMLFESKGR